MKTVIVIQDIEKPFEPEVFNNMTVACKRMGWAYKYLNRHKAREFPFVFKGYYVNKKTVKRDSI